VLEDIMKILTNLCILALFALTPALWALSTDKNQAIDLEADSVDINQATGVSVYSGNVELNQGSIQLKADKVTVYQYADKKKSTRFVATGYPARFRQRPDGEKQYIKAQANRMNYEIDSDNLELIGNAFISQPGKINMRSDRIFYNRVAATVKAGASAKGKERVRMRFSNPKK